MYLNLCFDLLCSGLACKNILLLILWASFVVCIHSLDCAILCIYRLCFFCFWMPFSCLIWLQLDFSFPLSHVIDQNISLLDVYSLSLRRYLPSWKILMNLDLLPQLGCTLVARSTWWSRESLELWSVERRCCIISRFYLPWFSCNR